MPTNKRGVNDKKVSFMRLLLLLATLIVMPTSYAQALNLDELLHHIDQLWRGQSSHTLMTMSVHTQHYQRTMQLEAWSKGTEHSLVIIREPVKDRGIATLKVQNHIWNYLPKINRVTKVPASMMAGSWMGSHFTNDDLVKENTFVQDFDAQLSFSGERKGRLIYEITAIPHADAAVVWGKVVILIAQDNLMPLQNFYFDESGQLIRTLHFSDPQLINGKVVPMRLTLQPEDKPEESTLIQYQSIRFGLPLEDQFFSLQNLKSRR